MGIDYESGFFELVCNFILKNSEQKLGEEQEEIFRTAAGKAGEECRNVKDVNWKELFYALVNSEEYKEFLNNPDKRTSENKKTDEKNIFDKDFEEKLIEKAKKRKGAFTWNLQYTGCTLEYIGLKVRGQESYRKQELSKKQEKFAEIIMEIDNEQDRIMDIFSSKLKKRIVWQFSAVEGEKFYDALEDTNVRLGISGADSNRYYDKYFSSDVWHSNCDLLWQVMKSREEKESQFLYLRRLEEVLCKLVPVAYKDGENWKLKTREQWERERERIKGAIQKKAYVLGLDKYTQDIITEEIKTMQEISGCEEYKKYEKEVFREKYADLMTGANKYFRKKMQHVHEVASNRAIKTKEDFREIYNSINK